MTEETRKKLNDLRPPKSDTAEGGRDYLRSRYSYYRKRVADSILDASVVALSLAIGSPNPVPQDVSDEAGEAFSLAFPDKPYSDLTDMTDAELIGTVAAWKGKFFEVVVRDRLNAGETVGDVQLAPGQFAQLASSPTQEGWDLQILNENGTTDEFLQLKASSSFSYISDHLSAHPEIAVLSTEEVANLHDELLNSGISNAELQAELTRSITDDHMDFALDSFADAVPFLPYILIAGTEGKRVLAGTTDLMNAARSTLNRGGKTFISHTIGGLVNLLGMGVFGIPVAFSFRIFLSRRDYKNAVGVGLRDKIDVFLAIQERQTLNRA